MTTTPETDWRPLALPSGTTSWIQVPKTSPLGVGGVFLGSCPFTLSNLPDCDAKLRMWSNTWFTAASLKFRTGVVMSVHASRNQQTATAPACLLGAGNSNVTCTGRGRHA